jgi:predicted Zn-dependent protease
MKGSLGVRSEQYGTMTQWQTTVGAGAEVVAAVAMVKDEMAALASTVAASRCQQWRTWPPLRAWLSPLPRS